MSFSSLLKTTKVTSSELWDFFEYHETEMTWLSWRWWDVLRKALFFFGMVSTYPWSSLPSFQKHLFARFLCWLVSGVSTRDRTWESTAIFGEFGTVRHEVLRGNCPCVVEVGDDFQVAESKADPYFMKYREMHPRFLTQIYSNMRPHCWEVLLKIGCCFFFFGGGFKYNDTWKDGGSSMKRQYFIRSSCFEVWKFGRFWHSYTFISCLPIITAFMGFRC